MQAHIVTFPYPVKLSERILVNLESLKGTWIATLRNGYFFFRF